MEQRTTELEMRYLASESLPERKFYTHAVEKPPETDMDAYIEPCCVHSGDGKSFEDYLVETLAHVRDGDGGIGCTGAYTDAPRWLEWFRHMRPLYFQLDRPTSGSVIYEITPKGRRFLAQHEVYEITPKGRRFLAEYETSVRLKGGRRGKTANN